MTTFDFPVTIAAGSNIGLLMPVGFNTVGVSGITCVYDPGNWNESMTLLTESSDSGYRIQLWGLLAPHVVGATQVRLSWTTGSDIGGRAMAFNGVKQTLLTEGFVAATPTSGTSNTSSITITSATGDMTLDISSVVSGWFINPTQTQYAEFGTAGAFGSYGSGAATVTHQWSTNDSGSRAWASIGTNIVASEPGTVTKVMWLH